MLLSMITTSKMLCVHVNTVRRWVKDGSIPHVRLGKRKMIISQDLETFINKNRVPPITPPTEISTYSQDGEKVDEESAAQTLYDVLKPDNEENGKVVTGF